VTAHSHPAGTYVETTNGSVHWGWIGKTITGVTIAAIIGIAGAVVTYVIQNERRVIAIEIMAIDTQKLLKDHMATDKPESGDHVTMEQFNRYQQETRDAMAKLITRDEMTATMSRLHSDIQQTRDMVLLLVQRDNLMPQNGRRNQNP